MAFDLLDDDEDDIGAAFRELEQAKADHEKTQDVEIEGDEHDNEHPEDGSRFARLDVTEILIVGADNVCRGGRVPDANHPDVQSLAKSIASEGLLHPIGVRPLLAPLPKSPAVVELERKRLESYPYSRIPSPHYRYRMVYGFERAIAMRDVLEWQHIPCMVKERTDEEAIRACIAENGGRRDPTDYDLAVALAALIARSTPRLTHEQVAQITGCRTPKVRTLVTIVERCPGPLLDAFRASPTAETRRTLERIATTVDPDSREIEATRHRIMVDEWARASAAERTPALGGAHGAPSPHGAASSPARTVPTVKAINTEKLERLRVELDEATEWQDPIAGWQPITAETRHAMASVLRYALDPKGMPRPIR
ncbi:MAG: hypothetical protein ABI632_07225 [Pseudolysinimonas sp.]